MANQFKLSDYGRDIPPVHDEDFYRFACAYYLHQDNLSWSRTQILFAVEAGVLTAAFSQSQRTWIAVGALLLGSVLVFLIWRLIQRDWEVRDQYLNFFDKFHKFNKEKDDATFQITIRPMGEWYRGSKITKSIIRGIIAVNLLYAARLAWPWLASHCGP